VRAPRILYVEDEPSIAEPFCQALAREGFAPTIARTAREALQLADELEPDLVLLDLGLPDLDGRDVCRELRGRSDVPIIMVTARDSEADRVLGLELGADDYVVKPFSAREVASRIRAVLRRSGPTGARAPERDLGFGALRIDVAARRVFIADVEVELSRKEFDLLVVLARQAGVVVTREKLMEDVWDTNWFGSTKTLDVHIGSLRRKLGDQPEAPRWVQTVRGVGFRFMADDGHGP
jgi:two-component system response regulator RegX3